MKGGLESFNAPSFSISVELFLYISFFIISLKFLKNMTQTIIVTTAALILYFFFESNLNLGKRTQIFGDISYTIYLVHFPIQIIFHIINKNYFVDYPCSFPYNTRHKQSNET